jgi:hypothetical protein
MAILPKNQIQIIMPKGGSKFSTSRPSRTRTYHSSKKSSGGKSGKSGSSKSK